MVLDRGSTSGDAWKRALPAMSAEQLMPERKLGAVSSHQVFVHFLDRSKS